MKKTLWEIFRHVTRCWPSHHALIHLLMSVDQGTIGPYNACAALVHYFNQWFIECSTIRNKLQWNLNQNTTIFIQENNALCHMIHFTIIVNHMMHFVPCDPWELLCDVCAIMQWLLSPTQWWALPGGPLDRGVMGHGGRKLWGWLEFHIRILIRVPRCSDCKH